MGGALSFPRGSTMGRKSRAAEAAALAQEAAPIIDPPQTPRAKRAAKRAAGAAAPAKAARREPSNYDWRLALRRDYEEARQSESLVEGSSLLSGVAKFRR